MAKSPSPQQTATLTIDQALEQALAYHGQGQLQDAEHLYRAILKAQPDHADANHNLGVLAVQVNKPDAGLPHLKTALEANLNQDQYWLSYIDALIQTGQTDAARQVLEQRRQRGLNGDPVEARADRLEEPSRTEPESEERKKLLALFAEGQYREATAIAQTMTARFPLHGFGWKALGAVFRKMGRSADALMPMRQAAALLPNDAEAHYNLGVVLQHLGRLDEATASYRRALEIEPVQAEAHYNLGNVLKERGRLGEAETSYRRALQNRPDYPEAHNNLGNTLKERGRLVEAEASYRWALQIRPDYAEAHSNLIFALDLMEGRGTKEQQKERRRWCAKHARRFVESIRPYGNLPDPERRLRVGYVSGDFRKHAASYAFGPIVRLHDRSAFEVICYSGVTFEDEVTARLRQAAHGWRSTLGLSDEAFAGQIRDDGIDILVDLSAHMSGNRLLVFARKPAPVQVTAWGYPNGTGLETIGYLLADPIVVPKEERSLFAEEVIDLPCFLCYEPPEYLPEVSPLPALAGKPFTFGCISRIEKISDGAIRVWSRILAALPDAVLLIKGQALDDPEHRQRFVGRLRAAGIGAERVRLIGSSSHAEVLKTFHEVDLGLDPFPHGGAIGTAEALWMGVPVVTLQGATFMGRITASILTAVQMQEWIAHCDDEYVRIAVQAARGLPRLARLRGELRSWLAVSVLGDVQRYTHAVENSYRSMWRRWCAEIEPESSEIQR